MARGPPAMVDGTIKRRFWPERALFVRDQKI